MPTTHTAPTEGLRVRKKRATENAIETSAVDLALSLGVEHVTVEMICERADISRSTFFNYFAGRDYAIVGRAIHSLQGEAAFAVLASCPGQLPRGIVSLIFASIGHQHVNAEVAEKRARLTAEQPAAQRLAAISILESSVSLTPVVLEWLLANPSEQKLGNPQHEATMSVALAYSVFAALLTEINSADGDTLPDETTIARAFENIRKLI